MSNTGDINVPAVFDTARPDVLKRDLDRLASGFIAFVKNLPNLFQERYTVGPIVNTGTTAAAFGVITRVAVLDSRTVNISMPRPDPKNGGRTLGIIRLATTGTVYLFGNGASINGRTRVLLISSIGMSTVTFDGQNYYTETAHAVPWDEDDAVG